MKLILTLPKIILLLTQVPTSFAVSSLSKIADDVASEVKDTNVLDWSNHDVFKTNKLEGDASMNNKSNGLRKFRDLSESIHRKLNDDLIPCNSIMDVMPLATVQAMVTGAFAYKFNAYTAGPPLVEAQLMIGERVPLMEHDVQMMKVCGSCESEGLNGYGCAADDYGYDTLHSGVLLLPVNIDEESSPAEVSIIDTADELQAYFGMRSIAITPKDSAVLLYTPGATVLEFGMFAASMGLVSILPHLTGFGESAKAGNGGGPLIPSVAIKKSKTTATLPLYAKAKSIVDEMSGGMTTVGNEAYFMGYSEGGNSAIAAADGFEKNGITPVKVMAGSAPLMIRSTSMLSLIQSLLVGASDPTSVNPFDVLFMALIGMAVSDTRPGPANFGQGQPFLTEESAQGYAALFTDKDAPAIYEEGNEVYFAYLQTNYLQLISNPNFLSTNFLNFFGFAIGNGDPDPCINVPMEQQVVLEVDKICATLNENDLTDVVINSSYELELCQAEDDTLIVPESVPDASKLKYSVPGGHGEGNDPCSTKFFYGTIFEKPNIREENNPSPTQSPNITEAPKSDKKTKAPKAPKSGKKSKAPKAPKSGKKSKA